VTDGRFVYLRNYMPHRPAGQHNEYMFQTPTTQVWKSLFDAGKETAAQAAFWQPKAVEELYDLQTDPDEVKNLAGDPVFRLTVTRLHSALLGLAVRISDVGFLLEGELHSRPKGASPYDWARGAGGATVTRAIFMANVATGDPITVAALRVALADDDSAVRYWAATGLMIRGQRANDSAKKELQTVLTDDSPYVRVVAAEALARYGSARDRTAAVDSLLGLSDCEKHGVFVSVAALNALDAVGTPSQAVCDAVKKLPTKPKVPDPRYDPYVARLVADFPARGK
jgi:uncharacterized sulfatase